MNIIYFGNSNISKPLIKFFLKYNFNVTYMYHSKIHSFKDDHVDLRDFLENNNIKFISFRDINSKRLSQIINNLKPDYIFSIGSSLILPKKIIDLTKFGTIGFHPTKLPLNRGRHPIIWTILLGLKKSATTFFYINEKVDEGDIIHQKEFIIKKNANADYVYNLIIKNAIVQLKYILNKIKKKQTLVPINNKIKYSNYWRSRSFSDGIISWNMSYEYIDRLVRALSYPYSGAVFLCNSKYFPVNKIKKIKKNENFEPGKIIKVNLSSFDIACFDYILRIYLDKLPISISKEKYLK